MKLCSHLLPFLVTISLCGISSSLPINSNETVSTLKKLDKSVEESSASARIVNGFTIDITAVPYQVGLRQKVSSGWAHSCGAVIIASRALLTAGHCVSAYKLIPSQLRAVVGTNYRLSGGTNHQIARIYVHESYSDVTLEHDIALLVTQNTIIFSQSVKPVSFDPVNLAVGTEALVSGYGLTSHAGTASSVLLAARVNIVAQEACARAYLRIATITSGMICANASNPRRDACQGDSGGPLVAKNNLVGIVSWGEGCADLKYPGVYTRVSEYNKWIYQKLTLI